MSGDDNHREAAAAAAAGDVDAVVCRECGAIGQTDVFCDSCGAVLRTRTLVTAVSAPPAGDAQATDGAAAEQPSAAPTTNWDHAPAADQASQAPDTFGDASAGVGAGNTAADTIQMERINPDTFMPRQSGQFHLAPMAEAAPQESSQAPEVPRAPEAPQGPSTQGTAKLDATQSLHRERAPSISEILSAPTDAPGAPAAGPDFEAPADVAAPLGFAAPAPVLTPSGFFTTPVSAAVPTDVAVPADTVASTEVQQRARELIVPVTESAVPESRIVPVQPGMPQPARPSVRLPQAHEVVGGVPCPWCGTPNPIDRHFCRRCAMNLASGPGAIARRPWWRRLWDRRRREIPYAGQRPRLRHGVARLVRRVVLVAVVVVLAFEIDAYAGTATMNVEDHFATPVQAFVTKISASHEDPSHPFAAIHDGFNNTWWGTGEAGDGSGVHVDATFGQPINLLDLIITPGAGVAQDAYTSQSRPETIDVTLYKADNSSTQSSITLNDTPGAQTFKVRGNDVTHVRLTIKSAYLADVPGQTPEVAIAEIEFYVRSSSHS